MGENARKKFEDYILPIYGGNDDSWLEWCPAGPCVRTPIHGGGIDDHFVGGEWGTWQASRRDALEDAARVADDARHAWVQDEWGGDEDYAAQRIAQAIRALKEQA